MGILKNMTIAHIFKEPSMKNHYQDQLDQDSDESEYTNDDIAALVSLVCLLSLLAYNAIKTL